MNPSYAAAEPKAATERNSNGDAPPPHVTFSDAAHVGGCLACAPSPRSGVPPFPWTMSEKVGGTGLEPVTPACRLGAEFAAVRERSARPHGARSIREANGRRTGKSDAPCHPCHLSQRSENPMARRRGSLPRPVRRCRAGRGGGFRAV